MAKRKPLIGIGIVLLLVVTVAGFGLIMQPQRRELSRSPNPDGIWTVVVGQQRLLGLLGIEIVHERQDSSGRVLSASVKGECSSWSEARRKHGTGP